MNKAKHFSQDQTSPLRMITPLSQTFRHCWTFCSICQTSAHTCHANTLIVTANRIRLTCLSFAILVALQSLCSIKSKNRRLSSMIPSLAACPEPIFPPHHWHFQSSLHLHFNPGWCYYLLSDSSSILRAVCYGRLSSGQGHTVALDKFLLKFPTRWSATEMMQCVLNGL